jgi:hypothetical protein
MDGSELGATDGDAIVLIVGKAREALGAADGLELGKIEGALFGSPLGTAESSAEGVALGMPDGLLLGTIEGTRLGRALWVKQMLRETA